MDAWCDGNLTLDPNDPLDIATRRLPARWAVYLMRDGAGRPVQLLSVRNVRASVRRRLGEAEGDGPTRKIDYRSVVRAICWKRVDSAFESDLVYLQIAREVFPDRFRDLIPQRRPTFLHVNPEAPFPRWTRVTDPTIKTGTLFGPIAEQQQAGKLIETLEDLFDLCRYYSVLAQSPSGSPCAYKDMGKCPAPCDGSVSMRQYRLLVEWSMATLRSPAEEIRQQTQRMREAAGELRFELASKIKQFIDGLRSLNINHWRHVRPLDDFRFLTLQPGPAKGKVKLFAVRPGAVTPVACVINDPRELLAHCAGVADLTTPGRRATITYDDADRISLVVKHLFWPKGNGIFLHGTELSEQSLTTAYTQMATQPAAEAASDEDNDEGVVAELAPGV